MTQTSNLHDEVIRTAVAAELRWTPDINDTRIGKVQGLIVDVTDHRVSHVLLQQGHLWGNKTVAIPFSEVRSVKDGVASELTKDQIRDLPPVDVYRLA